jgi:hypothetical protein
VSRRGSEADAVQEMQNRAGLRQVNITVKRKQTGAALFLVVPAPASQQPRTETPPQAASPAGRTAGWFSCTGRRRSSAARAATWQLGGAATSAPPRAASNFSPAYCASFPSSPLSGLRRIRWAAAQPQGGAAGAALKGQRPRVWSSGGW